MRIRKNKKGDEKGKRRKSALLKFTAATGTIIGTTLAAPGNTVFAKELESASTEGVDSELESFESASQTASESVSAAPEPTRSSQSPAESASQDTADSQSIADPSEEAALRRASARVATTTSEEAGQEDARADGPESDGQSVSAVDESASASASASESESAAASALAASESASASEEASAKASESVSGVASASESQSDSILVASESASASDSLSTSAARSESESASMARSEEESVLLSQSASAESTSSSKSESLSLRSSEEASRAASQSASLSETVSEANSVYASVSNSFSEAGLQDAYLEDLIAQIEVARQNLHAIQEAAARHNQSLANNSSFWKAGDTLANLLVRYSFYQDSRVTSIEYGSWEKNSGTSNYVHVAYYDESGRLQDAYFDYITVDKDGNALMDSKGKQLSGYSDPSKIDGIMVLQKTPLYNWWGKFKGFAADRWSASNYTNANGDARSGYFGIKGNYYFSESDFEKGKDEYSQHRSELTSVSHSASAARSQA